MPNAAPEHKVRYAALARKTGLAGLCAAAAFALFAPFGPGPAKAEVKLGNEKKSATYSYKFYVGGVLIGKADIDAKFGDGDYFTEGFMETEGVSEWFAAATVAAEARGRVEKAVLPRQLDVSGKTEDLQWKMTIAYEGDAPSAVSSQPPFKKKPYEIDPRKQKGALDPMSALIATLAPTASGTPCNRTIPVFDGRKRYDIVFGKQTFKGKSKTGHRMFECKSRWKPVAGFKPKMMKKDDIKFTARFEVRDGLTVPVRVWGETEFGDAIAIIKNIK